MTVNLGLHCSYVTDAVYCFFFCFFFLYNSWHDSNTSVCTGDFHYNIGIKHVFSCINIRQVPWEVLKTEAEGRGFQHLPRDLVNVNAFKNHVRSLLLHKNWNHLLHFALFLHYFVSPFHRCLENVISTDYARSRARQYASRNGSKSVAPIRSYWKLRSRALTARELQY